MPHGKRRAQRGGRKGGGSNTPARNDAYASTADMNNARFNEYYTAQKILSQEDWQPFLEALRKPLPTTFRVAGSRQIAHALNESIAKTYVPTLSNVSFEDNLLPPPKQIPWYPEGLAWQFNIPKSALRKSPEFKKFHRFLVHETDVGNISRQEAVSMLPPLFLGVEPHHRVIDLCAAPGSKTGQLLEALHANDTLLSSSIPRGIVVANDADSKRTHMLIHQAARLPSPALVVTNLDASIYPIIRVPSTLQDGLPVLHETTGRRKGKKHSEQLCFDRILADVPCSGDGTLRKNLGIWKRWSPGDGNGLHPLQVRILQRAMRMLAPGGRIVYSTCSLNPVENEAVVAAALLSEPSFHLVDVSDQLPELERRPGLTTWRPAVSTPGSSKSTNGSKINTTFSTYAEWWATLSEAQRVEAKLGETHWPPTDEALDGKELNLNRCIRVYPHLQDTGGFFVAVLERRPQSSTETSESSSVPPPAQALASASSSSGLKREAPEDETAVEVEAKKMRVKSPEPNSVDDDNDVDDEMEGVVEEELLPPPVVVAGDGSAPLSEEPKKKKVKGPDTNTFHENPYTFLSQNDPTVQACMTRLHLTPDFPSANLLTRNPTGEGVRALYVTNDLVKGIVNYNDYTRLRLTTAGTKVFARQEAGRGADAQFRVLGEGMPVVLPFIRPDTIIDVTDLGILKSLMEGYYPLIENFPDSFKSLIESREAGSQVVRFKAGSTENATLSHDLVLPLWKSNVSISLMIDKKTKSAMCLRIFGEDITIFGKEEAAKRRKNAPVPAEGAALEAVPEDIKEEDGVEEEAEIDEDEKDDTTADAE